MVLNEWTSTGNMVRLPQLSNSLDKLESFDLKELISELLMRNFSNGSYKGKAVFKPLWWPETADWPYKLTQRNRMMMVAAVKSCYEFYGLESLLLGPKCATPEPSKSTRLKVREEKGRRKVKKNLEAEQPLTARENLENSPLNSEERMVKPNGNYAVDSSGVHADRLLPKPDPRPFQIESAHCRRPQVKTKVLSKLEYLHPLGLITKTRAAHLSNSRRLSECTPDLEILDDDVIVTTPLSPTPSKSLISQMSRDASPFGSQAKRCLQEDDSDDTSSEASADRDIKLPNSHRLFQIDLCSELGSRVKPHLASLIRRTVSDVEERPEGVLPYEQYCHTPNKEATKEKLRDRLATGAGYPICYKKRPPKYSRMFCFNRAQKQERRRVLRTGLSQRARRLGKSLKRCTVKLNKLSPDVIKVWRQKRSAVPRSSPSPIKSAYPIKIPSPIKSIIDEDVIAISSDEETVSNRKRPHPQSSSADRRRPAKKMKSSRQPAMLFRCHLCNASLTCYDNARRVIQGHFQNLHKVFTIDLIEHQDAHNNRVMSIVEVAPPVNAGQSLWQKPDSSVVDLTLDDDDDDDPTTIMKKHRGISRKLFG